MLSSNQEWNRCFKELGVLLKKPEENLAEIKRLSVILHDYCHGSTHSGRETLEDRLWKEKKNLTFFTEKKPYSAAWHLYHSARIEDISCSYFLSEDEEIFDSKDYQRRLGIKLRHTAISIDLREMKDFNDAIDLLALQEYRRDVAYQGRQGINHLNPQKILERVSSSAIDRIEKSGSVIGDDRWLLEYWGNKNMAGIIKMPLTRHLLVHINSAYKAAK